MTTERRPLSGLEWLLLLTTGLAGTYLLTWVVLQQALPTAPPRREVAALPETRAPDVLPVAARAPRPARRPPRAATPSAPPAVRSRPHRVRTRSS